MNLSQSSGIIGSLNTIKEKTKQILLLLLPLLLAHYEIVRCAPDTPHGRVAPTWPDTGGPSGSACELGDPGQRASSPQAWFPPWKSEWKHREWSGRSTAPGRDEALIHADCLSPSPSPIYPKASPHPRDRHTPGSQGKGLPSKARKTISFQIFHFAEWPLG